MDADQVFGIIVGLVILVSVGIAFVGPEVDELTSTVAVVNESFNSSTRNSEVNMLNEPFVGTPTVSGNSNGTGLIDATNCMCVILASGNFSFDSVDGTINVSNGKYNNSVMNISYSYEPSSFISNGSTVTVLNLLVLFLALAGLVVVGRGVGLI